MIRHSLTSLLIASSLWTSAASSWKDICELEKLPNPEGIDPQFGALGTLPNGDLIATFHRGEIMIYSQNQKIWKPWGSGLHEPLGLHVENQHSIVVVQRAELTRISDTDKDGRADSYEAICSDWGMSGNYHEFAFGAAKSPDGHFYVALGTASNNGGARPEIRGKWNSAGGLTHDKIKPDWKPGGRSIMPRMFARVPYRGWIVKVNPASGEMTPVASGLRTPHGVHVNAKGEVFVNDNQGDWLGNSKLYKIEQGKFYGHPASLQWNKGWDRGTPAKLPVAELEQMRTKSLCFLPQGDLANSPTQILTLPQEGFGPYSGNLIMGDMNQPRLVRYLPDTVNGQQQGAALGFMEHPDMGRGNAKLSLGKKGTLYVGKTHLSWAGAEGLLALKYNQRPHLAIKKIALTKNGFKITLNEAPDLTKVELKGISYGLLYHQKYGSKKMNSSALEAKSIEVKENVIDVILVTKPLADKVYDISLNGISSSKLGNLIEPRFFYTAHAVVK